MHQRDVPTILAEWRALERQLDAASDDELRDALRARIGAVRAEHAEAMAERRDEADVLGQFGYLSPDAEHQA
jgi:hypothetical protein